ncbi:MAG: LysR family transcriptional regulator [Tepidanaerobacteraceae bacterium]|jgi:DNA-binding transcriptional LysR family regulator|nr:LysR family transcriptional regulator [Tepidanaerobacteraceae bacterium]
MEIHQLEYVLAVATHQSFTRAAEKLNVSQSSLSQQISKLEKELGVNLFLRTTRAVQLTPAGAEFCIHARKILSEISLTRQSINEYSSYERGSIALGVMPVIGYYKLHRLVASFKKNFPGIDLNLLEAECEDLLQMLHDSKIDAAILSQTNSDPHFQFYPLITDKMVVVTDNLHPISHEKSVNIASLANENFIVPPPNSGNYQDFRNACCAAGFEPKILLHCSQVETILGLVSEGLGISVLAYPVAVKSASTGLSILSLEPTIFRKIFLAIHKNENNNPAIKVFIKFSCQWINIKNTHNGFSPDSKEIALNDMVF